MKVLFSLFFAPTIEVVSGPWKDCDITVAIRDSDWGLSGGKRYWYYLQQALKVLRQARDFDVLVLCTAGIEAFIVARLRNLICPHTTIVGVDLLIPHERKVLRLIRPWLRRLDGFGCIRRGDIETFGIRFSVPREKCFFVYFPVREVGTDEKFEGGYIYSAGQAHRDWPTLIEALSRLPYPALLSAGGSFDVPTAAAGRIKVLPQQLPQDGRKLMRSSTIVVLSLEDTSLSSGPLILLDAMAMQKAVVATDVNGTRDYVRNGETALLVPPRDVEAMAHAINSLMSDAEHRQKIARQAQQDVRQRFTTDGFLETVLDACSVLHAAKPQARVLPERFRS